MLSVPFFRPQITAEEIERVGDVLASGWLTTGTKCYEFEEKFAEYVGANHALAVSSATVAMAMILEALEIGYGDEVICPVYTFSSPAMEVHHAGATPVLVDCERDTLNPDPEAIERAITPRTKAILVVHYGGLPCDIDRVQSIAAKNGLYVIEDAAHCCPSKYASGEVVGSNSRSAATFFSFYANKCITTGEGGMITTQYPDLAEKLKTLRLHGISKDVFDRYTDSATPWRYDIVSAGFKANLPDPLAALGIAQLEKADAYWARREEIARTYTIQLSFLPHIETPTFPDGLMQHSWHLYPIRMQTMNRDLAIKALGEMGVHCSVHFIPLHLFTFWRKRLNLSINDFPVATSEFEKLISLPIFPAMTDEEVAHVCTALCDLMTFQEAA